MKTPPPACAPERSLLSLFEGGVLATDGLYRSNGSRHDGTTGGVVEGGGRPAQLRRIGKNGPAAAAQTAHNRLTAL